MVETIFLTDNRREVLAGETELEGDSLAVAKSRIRVRARMALQELIQVAQSEEIDNSTVFEPRAIESLLESVMGPRDDIEPIQETDDWKAHQERYWYENFITSVIYFTGKFYAEHLFAGYRTEEVEPDYIEGIESEMG